MNNLKERLGSSHLVLSKTLNIVSLWHYVQVEVMAMRARNERQQTGT